VPTTYTLIEMSSESGRTATLDGGQHFEMQTVQPVTIAFNECASGAADKIGHLQGWLRHLIVFAGLSRKLKLIQRTRSSVQMQLRQVQIYGGFFQILMAEQDLNRPEIRSGFK
jgi:hypothetical protein